MKETENRSFKAVRTSSACGDAKRPGSPKADNSLIVQPSPQNNLNPNSATLFSEILLIPFELTPEDADEFTAFQGFAISDQSGHNSTAGPYGAWRGEIFWI
jgi:hypothetical protein